MTNIKIRLSVFIIPMFVLIANINNAFAIDEHNQNTSAELSTFSQAELDQMLAPIALYPDTLLTHILIASTYPIEIIDADRFVKLHKNYSEYEINQKLEKKDWDPSVKALVPFPKILENLSTDLAWMRKLGDAFLQDESQVLASIQALRTKADEAGNLTQMDNVQIVREKRTIVIESTQPEVVYVPYYDTRVVYGNWHWSHYPPVYWHRPTHYAYYHGPFYWHSGVHIAYDFFFTAFHWNKHHVVRHHHKKRYHHSNRRIATSHHAKRWHHNPKHRKGVAYRNKKVKHRYHSDRPSREHSRSIRKQHHETVVVHNRHNNNKNHGYQTKKHTAKHQQVSKRLQVNKAVKVNRQRTNHKQKYHDDRKLKPYNAVKKNQGRVVEHKQVNKQKVYREKVTKSQSKKQYAGNTWQQQPKVRMADSSYKVKQHKQKSYNNKTYKTQPKKYKAKGGHSSKQYAKVAKNSSSNTKSRSTRNRQKHQ